MTNTKIEGKTPIREFSRPVVEKVAIVGGGPGGLATAIALRKQDINAQVYERG